MDKSNTNQKQKLPMASWISLSLLVICAFGACFTYDSIGGLSVGLVSDYGFTTTMIGILYSVYGVPNLVMPFVGGVLCDWIGRSKGLMIFSVCCFVGSVIVAATDNFTIMIVGRFIVAIGGETSIAAIRAIVMQWFPDSSGYQAIAMSIAITTPWMASVLCFLILPMAEETLGVAVSLWIPAIATAVSLAISIGYFILEKFHDFPLALDEVDQQDSTDDEHGDVKRQKLETVEFTENALDNTIDQTTSEKTSLLKSAGSSSNRYSSSERALYSDQSIGTETSSSSSSSNQISKISDPHRETISIKDFSKLTFQFWILVISNVLVAGALWPFLALSPDFFHEKYHFSPILAGICSSVFSFSALLASPIFGWLADRFDKRAHVGLLSAILGVIGFAVLAFTEVNPFLGSIILGLSLGINAAVCFPEVGRICDPKITASAFGVLKTTENIAYIIVPFVYGYVADTTGSFEIGLALFCAFCVFAAGCFVLLLIFPSTPWKETQLYTIDDFTVLENDTDQQKNVDLTTTQNV